MNVIRYGDEDEVSGMEKVRVAAALIERYAPNGRAISQSMLNAIQADFESVPAEVLADHVLSQLKGDALFRVARSLELEGFKVGLLGFDQLPLEEKAFLGVLLDFAGLDRASFAEAWRGNVNVMAIDTKSRASRLENKDSPGPLFENINATK